MNFFLIMAGSEGFEPSANGLRGRRSTLLSYEPSTPTLHTELKFKPFRWCKIDWLKWGKSVYLSSLTFELSGGSAISWLSVFASPPAALIFSSAAVLKSKAATVTWWSNFPEARTLPGMTATSPYSVSLLIALMLIATRARLALSSPSERALK